MATGVCNGSDELIFQREMDCYNFFASRASANHGTHPYDGYGSFFEDIHGMVSLNTEIDSLCLTDHARISKPMTVTYPPFGQRDWRGLVFDAPVPSRVKTDASLRLTGRVDPKFLRGGYRFLVFRATRYCAPASAGTVVQTTLNGGRFSVPLAFTEDQVGSYAIDAFVFMDGEGLPISTSTVTPFFVEQHAGYGS